MTKSKFNDLLAVQIGNEFAASQQYIAVAVWFAGQDLPQLAKYFYRQSVEERNHAMMMVQYMLDRNLPVSIPGVPHVQNDFSAVTLSRYEALLEQGADVVLGEIRGVRR